MTTSDRSRCAEGRDAADGVAGGRLGLLWRWRAACGADPTTVASLAMSTRSVPRTRAMTGSSSPSSRGGVDGRHEDEALDDLAELDADGVGGLLGRVRGLVEGHDLDGHAALGGGLAHAFVGRMGIVGHGRESRTSTIGSRWPALAGGCTIWRWQSHMGQGSADEALRVRDGPQTLGT